MLVVVVLVLVVVVLVVMVVGVVAVVKAAHLCPVRASTAGIKHDVMHASIRLH